MNVKSVEGAITVRVQFAEGAPVTYEAESVWVDHGGVLVLGFRDHSERAFVAGHWVQYDIEAPEQRQ